MSLCAFDPTGISESLAAVFSTTAAASTSAAATAGATAATAAGTSAAVGFTGASGAALSAGALSAATPAIGAIGSASSFLPVLGYASTGLNVAGGAVGALGAIQTAQAQAGAAKENAAIATINQNQATENATLAGEAGSAQAGIQSQKARAQVGSIIANQAAGGIDVNTGSAKDTQLSERDVGELDALQVRSNATKEAYGYQTQATSFGDTAALDTTEAKNDQTAGGINAASTFLGGAGSAASNYAKYQLSGGFGY